MELEIGSLHSGGLVVGVNPLELAPNVFNDVANVEFTREGVRPLRQPVTRNLDVPGSRLVYHAVDTMVNGGIRVVLCFCEDKVYALRGSSYLDVTPAGMLSSKEWSVTEFNGYVVACNGKNFPYYYDFADADSVLKILPEWPEELVPQKLSSMSGFLVFMGLVSDGTFANQLIVWSDAAELGSLPDNYNWADPTSRAGFYSLPDFEEFVAAVLLNKSLIIYRTNSIYEMRFIGGTLVFSIEQRFEGKTLISSKAVAAKGRLHYCIGENEFYVHDGSSEQVFDVRPVSDYYFNTVNPDYAYLTQMVYDQSQQRLHICYPSGNDTLCTRDLFFDFKSNCWSLELLDGYSYIGDVFISSTPQLIYEDANMTFEDSTDDFNLVYDKFSNNRLVYFNGSIFQVGGESQVKQATLTRNLVAYTTQDTSGTTTVKRNLQLLITELWPKLYSGQVQFRLGFSETPLGTITWSDWVSTNGLDRLDFFLSGLYLHLQIRNEGQDFTLNGYMLQAAPTGKIA
ncbi:MAG: hypothetical protein [Siphoviridae sp. ct7UA22]|nr:MAG: hypothetical protein [Siphoviridae sp. ct7UA22]